MGIEEVMANRKVKKYYKNINEREGK
jgi:hypothetical protein